MNKSQTGNKLNLPEAVVLLDSLGDLKAENKCPILVCGSHCGGNRALAEHVKNSHVKAAFLNNAGVGKNNAGIRGLTHYEAEGVLACAVDNHSAEIGVACDTYENGIITHTTKQAKPIGIQAGDSVKEAIGKMISYGWHTPDSETQMPTATKEAPGKENLKTQSLSQVDGQRVTVTDSITFLSEKNANEIVVCGSHGGLSAGHYAQKHGVKAVFFNDAGIGRNQAGVKSLEGLNEAGILACTVDCMSAEIFNGQDALDNGIISTCNQLAKDRGILEKMTAKEAIKQI